MTVLVLAGTLALVVSTGCSGDQPHQTPAGKVKPAKAMESLVGDPATSVPIGTPEEAVGAAYTAIVRRAFAGQEAPDPGDPQIAADHIGASLREVQRRYRQLLASGEAIRFRASGPPSPQIQRVMIDGPTAKVRSCLVNDTIRYEIETQRVVDDGVDSFQTEATVRFIDRRWKLADQSVSSQWPGRNGCDR